MACFSLDFFLSMAGEGGNMKGKSYYETLKSVFLQIKKDFQVTGNP
jgi:hypothetical protein